MNTKIKINFEAFLKESPLIVIETTAARDFWVQILEEVNLPSDQIVRLPGFRGNVHRRSWFQTGDNFQRCELAKVFWVPNLRTYQGHSEVLYRWLLQKGLVLVDNTASCGSNLICCSPLTRELRAFSHSRNVAGDKVVRGLTDRLDTASVNRIGTAKLQLFPAVGGEFLHIHVDDIRTLNCVREYYRDQDSFLSLNLDAITENEPFLYDRLVGEIVGANILFFQVSGDRYSPEIQVDSIFHWLDWGRAVVVCSVGTNWPTFDRVLDNAESAYINYIYIPALPYTTEQAEKDYQQPQLFPKLVVDQLLSNSEPRLYDTYIQYG